MNLAKIYYAARIDGDGGATEIDSVNVVLENDYAAILAENKLLREALETLIVGACAVGVPNQHEREVLLEAISIARTATTGGE